MNEDVLEVHPLAMVPYVLPPLEDPTVLLIGALVRLRILEHRLRELKAN